MYPVFLGLETQIESRQRTRSVGKIGGSPPAATPQQGQGDKALHSLGPCFLSSPPLSPSHPQEKNLPVQQQWQIPVLQAFLNHHGDQLGGGEGGSGFPVSLS